MFLEERIELKNELNKKILELENKLEIEIIIFRDKLQLYRDIKELKDQLLEVQKNIDFGCEWCTAEADADCTCEDDYVSE